jgi:hypothetical protein
MRHKIIRIVSAGLAFVWLAGVFVCPRPGLAGIIGLITVGVALLSVHWSAARKVRFEEVRV